MPQILFLKSKDCSDRIVVCTKVNVLKFGTCHSLKKRRKKPSYFGHCFVETFEGIANSVDPDQAGPEAVYTLIRLLLQEQSDLGLHCLQAIFVFKIFECLL